MIEALKTNYIKIILFILRIIDKEEREAIYRANAFTSYNLNTNAYIG